MRKFDPWPVFFKREWNRNWPFIVGFATTGAIITKYSLSLTEEDAKKSPFVQRHKKKYVEKYPDVTWQMFGTCARSRPSGQEKEGLL
ncbi:atp synthase 6 kda subunit [Quercus suber]